MPRPTTYTTAERIALAVGYTTATKDELLDAFPTRTWNALQLQARAMGMTRPVGNWTAAALATLAANYPLQGAKYVTALVGHGEEMVRRKAKQLHILRLPAPPRPRLPSTLCRSTTSPALAALAARTSPPPWRPRRQRSAGT